MKIKLIALTIFLGVISFLTFFKNNGIKAPVAEKKPQSLDDLFMVSSAKGKSIVEEFVHKINSNDLEVENPIKSTFTDAFKPWNKLKLSLSKKNHRREIVQELISREGVVDFSSKILIDKNLAVETLRMRIPNTGSFKANRSISIFPRSVAYTFLNKMKFCSIN